MTHTSRFALALAIAAGCLATVTISLFADGTPPREELAALFARYDRESDGPAKDSLAARIDAVAHQKYATVSRLYWHTDLASARAAAREHGRPILHLRMLGRLDEDLSCANSRLFRATLYANQDVSRFLRENFILYWSSERPVPRVTIDYGDGRRLERTTTGNSAHYVLDEDGNVLDVLPGLYAPTAFRRELEGSLALAARVRGQPDHERAKRLVDYHEQRVIAARRDWERLAGTARIPRAGKLLTPARIESQPAAAQRLTVAKSTIEVKDLRVFATGLTPEAWSEDQIEMWSAAGQVLRLGYRCGASQLPRPRARRHEPRADCSLAQSRAARDARDRRTTRDDDRAPRTDDCRRQRAQSTTPAPADRRRDRAAGRPDRLRHPECVDLRRGLSHPEAGRLARSLAAERVYRIARRRSRHSDDYVRRAPSPEPRATKQRIQFFLPPGPAFTNLHGTL